MTTSNSTTTTVMSTMTIDSITSDWYQTQCPGSGFDVDGHTGGPWRGFCTKCVAEYVHAKRLEAIQDVAKMLAAKREIPCNVAYDAARDVWTKWWAERKMTP